MAEYAKQNHAQATTKPAEANRDSEPRERHEGLEARPGVQANLDYGKMLNRRPALVAQRKAVEQLAGRAAAGPRPVQPAPKRANNTGLPDQLKSGIENLSGFSMDDVTVHYGSAKPAQLQALAYTQGTDIQIASGQERHLPHEAWHVVQQKQGRVKSNCQMKGVAISDDAALEREADLMGVMAQARTHPCSLEPQLAPLTRGIVQRVEVEAQDLVRGQPYSFEFMGTQYRAVFAGDSGENLTFTVNGDTPEVTHLFIPGKIGASWRDYPNLPIFETVSSAAAAGSSITASSAGSSSSASAAGPSSSASAAGPSSGASAAAPQIGANLTWAAYGYSDFDNWAKRDQQPNSLNCWEFVIFWAVENGHLSKEKVKADMIHNPSECWEGSRKVYKNLLKSTGVLKPLEDPSRLKPGNIIEIKDPGDLATSHVAISLGGDDILHLFDSMPMKSTLTDFMEFSRERREAEGEEGYSLSDVWYAPDSTLAGGCRIE